MDTLSALSGYLIVTEASPDGATMKAMTNSLNSSSAAGSSSARPPAPKPPRSHLLPVSATLIALLLAVGLPSLRAASQEEPAAAQAPASEPEQVTMTVRTAPEGATVRVGQQSCQAPCDLTVDAGESLMLSAANQGWKRLEQEVVPEPGMAPLELTLEALPFVLAVDAPEGAIVSVAGEPVENPRAIELGTTLQAPVAVEVRASGFRPYRAEVAVDSFTSEDERRSATLQVDLQRAARRSVRSAAPSPAEASGEPEGPVPSNPFG